jgi:prephenate dehydrogenase
MKIGIIGHGRFGKLWAEACKPFGTVLVFDKDQEAGDEESLENVLNVDIVFLIIPISEIESVCKQITDLLSTNTIVVDACSVKKYPAEIMKRELAEMQPIVATHPLFGPDSVKRDGMGGQKIVVCPVRGTDEQFQQCEDLLTKLKLEIIRVTPEEHDSQMARSQSLVHFLGRGLAELKLQDQAVSTPDYHSLLRIDDLVVHDTWQLFFDMQRYNPFAKDVRLTLLHSLQALEKNIESNENDIESLRQDIVDIDQKIIQLIGSRLSIVKQVGAVKQKSAKNVFDKSREEKLQKLYGEWSDICGVDKGMIGDVFDRIIEESRRIQEDN